MHRLVALGFDLSVPHYQVYLAGVDGVTHE